jgi:hypothetical protein
MPLPNRRPADELLDCPGGKHQHVREDYKVCRCGAWICPSCAPSDLLWELSACDEHCGLQALLALQRRADGFAGAAADFELGLARAVERAA